MSDPEFPDDRSLTIRIATALFLVILATPFANEGAKRLLDGDYLYGGIAFIIALASFAVAVLFWIGKNQILEKFQLLRVTADARWWVALLFVLLLYFGWSSTQIGHQANYLAVGPDPWEGSPLAIAWRTAQLREPVPNSPFAKYYRFIVNARNIGDEPITLKDGYIVSSTDESRIPMLLSVPNEQPFSIDDA
jgi:membrane protease YdiL (CAAX protease family)